MSRRRRLRSNRISVIAIVLGSLALAVAILQLTGGFNLPGGEEGPEDSRNNAKDLGSDDFTSRDEEEATKGLTSPSDLNTTIFGPPQTLARRHSYTMSITTTATVSWGYLWRDGESAENKVTSKSETVSRTFVTSRPAAIIGAQLTGAGGRVTCSVSVDGERVSTHSVSGAFQVVFCVG